MGTYLRYQLTDPDLVRDVRQFLHSLESSGNPVNAYFSPKDDGDHPYFAKGVGFFKIGYPTEEGEKESFFKSISAIQSKFGNIIDWSLSFDEEHSLSDYPENLKHLTDEQLRVVKKQPEHVAPVTWYDIKACGAQVFIDYSLAENKKCLVIENLPNRGLRPDLEIKLIDAGFEKMTPQSSQDDFGYAIDGYKGPFTKQAAKTISALPYAKAIKITGYDQRYRAYLETAANKAAFDILDELAQDPRPNDAEDATIESVLNTMVLPTATSPTPPEPQKIGVNFAWPSPGGERRIIEKAGTDPMVYYKVQTQGSTNSKIVLAKDIEKEIAKDQAALQPNEPVETLTQPNEPEPSQNTPQLQPDSETLNSFIASLPESRKQRVAKALQKTDDGRTMADVLESLVESGHTVGVREVNGRNKRGLLTPGGDLLDSLSKIELEYVAHLTDQSQSARKLDPKNPEDYALILKDKTLRDEYKAQIDAHLLGRIQDIRNELRGLGWESRSAYSNMTKSGHTLKPEIEYIRDDEQAYDYAISMHYEIEGVPGLVISETLESNHLQMAERINRGLTQTESKGRVEVKTAQPAIFYDEKQDKLVHVAQGPNGNFSFYRTTDIEKTGSRIKGPRETNNERWFDTADEAETGLVAYAQKRGFPPATQEQLDQFARKSFKVPKIKSIIPVYLKWLVKQAWLRDTAEAFVNDLPEFLPQSKTGEDILRDIQDAGFADLNAFYNEAWEDGRRLGPEAVKHLIGDDALIPDDVRRPHEMTIDEFVNSPGVNFVKEKGKRRYEGILIDATKSIHPVEDQRYGKLTRPEEDILKDLHRRLIEQRIQLNEQALLPNALPSEQYRAFPLNVQQDYPDLFLEQAQDDTSPTFKFPDDRLAPQARPDEIVTLEEAAERIATDINWYELDPTPEQVASRLESLGQTGALSLDRINEEFKRASNELFDEIVMLRAEEITVAHMASRIRKTDREKSGRYYDEIKLIDDEIHQRVNDLIDKKAHNQAANIKWGEKTVEKPANEPSPKTLPPHKPPSNENKNNRFDKLKLEFRDTYSEKGYTLLYTHSNNAWHLTNKESRTINNQEITPGEFRLSLPADERYKFLDLEKSIQAFEQLLPAPEASLEQKRPEQKTKPPEFPAIRPYKEQKYRNAKYIGKLFHDLGIAQEIANSTDYYRKVFNEPFMPLTIERHGDQIYLTHYREQMGDLVSDGEMVFKVSPEQGLLFLKETAVPNTMVFCNGDEVPNANQGAEIRGCDPTFANLFAKNLNDQGFGDCEAVDPRVEAGKKQEPNPLANLMPSAEDFEPNSAEYYKHGGRILEVDEIPPLGNVIPKKDGQWDLKCMPFSSGQLPENPFMIHAVLLDEIKIRKNNLAQQIHQYETVKEDGAEGLKLFNYMELGTVEAFLALKYNHIQTVKGWIKDLTAVVEDYRTLSPKMADQIEPDTSKLFTDGEVNLQFLLKQGGLPRDPDQLLSLLETKQGYNEKELKLAIRTYEKAITLPHTMKATIENHIIQIKEFKGRQIAFEQAIEEQNALLEPSRAMAP